MKTKTMDIILILLYITVLIFTGVMYWTYMVTGGIPDTLCTCFFVAVTGECGFMGIIKSVKEKYRNKEQELEDLKKIQEEVSKQPEFKGGQ